MPWEPYLEASNVTSSQGIEPSSHSFAAQLHGKTPVRACCESVGVVQGDIPRAVQRSSATSSACYSACYTPLQLVSGSIVSGTLSNDTLFRIMDAPPGAFAVEPEEPDSQDTLELHYKELSENVFRELRQLRERKELQDELDQIRADREHRVCLAVRRETSAAFGSDLQWLGTMYFSELATLIYPHEDELVAARSIVANAAQFYIGACQSPLRRWVGDMASDRPMTGHHADGWHAMHVFAAREGPAGPTVEKKCIELFSAEFHDPALPKAEQRSRNKSLDARGLSGKPGIVNFISICTKW